MCGRFTLMIDAEELQAEYGLQAVPANHVPRYNIAPSQPIAVIKDWPARSLDWMRWGLVPQWAKDPAIGNSLINARAETAHEKPSFRAAFARRRCLIPADGFYEWQKAPMGKGPSTPYFFYAADHKPFAFAGLWELWQASDGSEIQTCTILTTSANSLVAPIHERMPVILSGSALGQWLAPAATSSLSGLLKPYPASLMSAHSVSAMVNSPFQDRPELVIPYGG